MRKVGKGEIRRVYRSYLAGSRTTAEVSAHLGFTVKKCSAYTMALIDLGAIERGGFAPDLDVRPGRKRCWYEPAKETSHA